jgi:hypothetical protein
MKEIKRRRLPDALAITIAALTETIAPVTGLVSFVRDLVLAFLVLALVVCAREGSSKESSRPKSGPDE